MSATCRIKCNFENCNSLSIERLRSVNLYTSINKNDFTDYLTWPRIIYRCYTNATFLCFLSILPLVEYFYWFFKFCDEYGTVLDIHIHMIFALIPIMSCAMIRNLKFIAPLSTAANISMAIGLGIILSYCLVDLPPLNSRTAVAHWSQIPLFFGTAIYAFEGISLVSTDPIIVDNHRKIRRNYYFEKRWILCPCTKYNVQGIEKR